MIMKKITLSLYFLICIAISSHGQLNISVDNADGAGWNAYVNAFNTSNGSYAFGFSYDLTKQKTQFDGTNVTVKPNYGIWVDACSDAAWFNGNTCPNPTSPNKNIEALSYLQKDRSPNPEFFNQDVIFSGNIESFTIDAGYTVKAFISVFPIDFSYNTQYTADITGTGTFSITRPLADVVASDKFFQYGFIVFGLPANPANEASLGSVVFKSNALSLDEFSASNFQTYPNPAQDSWNIKTNNIKISSVQVYDILGKAVISLTPNFNEVTINATNLKSGLYFAKVETEAGINTVKLIKK